MQKKKSTLKYIFCLCVQIEALEQMVDMTAKLFECDRDEMYNYLLRLCSKSFPFICLCALLFGFSVCGFDLQTAPPPRPHLQLRLFTSGCASWAHSQTLSVQQNGISQKSAEDMVWLLHWRAEQITLVIGVLKLIVDPLPFPHTHTPLAGVFDKLQHSWGSVCWSD